MDITIVANIRGVILLLVVCHLIGDYVLQNDFIAKTKGENFYHLIIHSLLYLVPFMFFLSGWQLSLLLCSHVIIDSLKATHQKITYAQDQVLHYIVLVIIFITLL